MEVTEVDALVPRDQVEHLREALLVAGVDEANMEVRPAAPGRYELHDETLHDDATGARHGLLVGAGVGAVLGLVVALLVPAISGALAITVTTVTVSGFGGLVGAMTGLQRADTNDADPITYHEVTDADAFSLVLVHDEHWHYRAHRVLEQHGAIFVESPHPEPASA